MNNITEISQKICPDDPMLEENPVSRLCIRPNCTEKFEETKKATSNIVGVHISLEQSQMSTCSEAPLSSNNSTNQSSLQCHFVSLKQQMAGQKAEYEAKITSLELRNKELQLEIKDLHSKLGQQRKWYHLVEIKMRNAERAREDAERRNATLQKEMEQFFDTFGELTNELKAPEQNAQSF
ncbi:rho GTPase-activating protein 24-like [Eublepharis macularius]|uniref:Rho GTPase-activating protein 24-like n=1 Tax=Eublepharis macularius TaxID=481883 RepID=A0AA97J742_EUBMA|nr:rho GTPase-activating protein 24-like [Eublepharis macularius]